MTTWRPAVQPPRGVVPDVPGPGQRSVWDFPRPPALEPLHGVVRVEHGGRVVAETSEALQVLETSHPPSVYLPPGCFADGVLVPGEGSSHCEFKGRASYLDLVVPGVPALPAVAWTYPRPTAAYAALAGFVSLYPGRVDRCTVDGEVVRGQDGSFYGDWVTDAVAGPWKGGPGTWGW